MLEASTVLSTLLARFKFEKIDHDVDRNFHVLPAFLSKGMHCYIK